MNGILPPIGHTPSLPYVPVSGLGGVEQVVPAVGRILGREPGQGIGAAAAAAVLALPERVQMEPG